MENFSEEYICFSKYPPIQDRKLAKAILWPVYIWQVYGPDFTGKTINIFERTLLSLLSMNQGRLNDTRLVELAEWLGLEPDMVKYIIDQQLVPQGWVDSRSGSITLEGHEALQEQDERSNALKAGYVFQDAVDGNYLPRYSKTIDLLEPETTKPPKFALSKASTYRHQPTLISSSVEAHAPSQADLRMIIEGHNAAARNLWLSGDENQSQSWTQLDNLALSNHKPIPAYLWVWIYPMSSIDHIWAAADPFVWHDDVSWMREKIESVSRRYKTLANEILTMLGEKSSDDNRSLDEIVSSRTEQVSFEVEMKYPTADKIDGLTNILHGWMTRQLEVETSYRSDLVHDYRDLINQSGGIIEVCVRYCLNKFPFKSFWIIKKSWNQSDIKLALTRSIPSLSEKQLELASAVGAGKLFWAAKNGQGAFKTYFAAVLLSMSDYPNHPLKFLINNERLFVDAYKATDWRNNTAHLNEKFESSKTVAIESAAIAEQFLKNIFQGLNNV